MNRLLLSSILATGLAFGASGVFAADQYGSSDQPTQQTESYQQNTDAEHIGSEAGEYTVQEGDTLSTIAESELGSQDRWQEIAQANNLENPDRIFVGQKLTIPSGQSMTRNDAYDASKLDRAAQNEAYDKNMSAESGEAMNEARNDQAPDVQNEQSMDQTEQELKGEITEIDAESDSFSLKDEQGMTHLFTKLEDNEILEEVSVGDFVKVGIENGTVVSLEKVDRSA